MLWEIVKAVTVFTSLHPPLVMMRSDSTNRRWSIPVRMCSMPSTGVRAGERPARSARLPATKEGAGRREPHDLPGSVEAFQTHEHIRRRGGEAGDVDGAPGQSACAPHRPVLGERVVGHRSPRGGDVRAARPEAPRRVRGAGSLLDRAPSKARRRCPVRFGVAPGRAGRTSCASHARRGGGEQNKNEDCAFHFTSMAATALAFTEGPSIVTA